MNKNSDKSLQYITGGIIGALIGVAAIYFMEKSGELNDEENIFNRKTLASVGLGAISFLYSLIGKGKGRGRKGLR